VSVDLGLVLIVVAGVALDALLIARSWWKRIT
jgi:hypothetical protein